MGDSRDSRSPDSSSVSSPPSGQRSPPLVPSSAASMTSLPPISTSGVDSPISSIGSPFSVISSSLGSPCLPGTPSIGYGPISSPQINSTVSMSGLHAVSSSDDVKPPFGLNQLSPQSPGPMLSQKRLCAICGDRSSGKHYGVYSCEGCKGFFKRTVRKDLSYTCRDLKTVLVDKRQRPAASTAATRQCLAMGLKREAVQEERQRNREREGEVESTSVVNEEMPVEKILEAEVAIEQKTELHADGSSDGSSPNDPVTNICQAADKQLFTLVEWAKRIPHFSELALDDQVILLRAGWNELLIASFSHRSISVKDGILLATGLHVHRNSAHSAGVGAIFDRVLTELVSKMRDMQMDKTELGCLRAIILFNPDAKGLSIPSEVELLRERVYASLESYCKQKYPDQQGRFAKLLLRLPALRSIGLKCLEHLFFFKLIGDTPIDTFLMEMLEAPHQLT
ncbi:LOW QUALITY PROTEIN: retinoic acid receptor RXR-beta-A [Trematomus bernacchii]|uniref:LOW QUALITY PROTEIN: retinoic acid receptor RXR-beta-A n=1 Tax=Trematomus bernacchii TaxID=40690 RepID=UPI00146D9B17|nr:LOW QUALITY PROTEIN: retinoic acid receptor RXR-beta-A [Trematomus bernacchii]